MNAQQAVQRRRYSRRRLEAPVAVCGVVSSAAQVWRGHTLNLSEGGAAIILGGDWLPGQVVRMEIAIDSEHPMQLIARISHRDRLFCGLEFLAKSDEASMELRQAVAS